MLTADLGRRRQWLAAGLLLLLLPAGWLGPSALGRQTFVPFDLAAAPPAAQQLSDAQLAAARADCNYDVTETMIWYLPELRLAQRIVRDEGAFPAWNPEARGGAPLHGHGEDGLLYPPTWLPLFAADPARWLWLTCWLSLAVAGLGTLGLLHALRLSPPAALFGAITFQCSGVLAANAHFAWRLASLVWLPVLLWTLVAMRRRPAGRRLPPAIGFGLAFAASWLGGFPVYASANSLIAAAFGLLLVLHEWGERGRDPALRLWGAMAVGAGLGVLLAMPQVLPSLQFFAYSARDTAPGLADLGRLAADPAGLLHYLVPDLFGRPDLAAQLPLGDQPRSPLWLLLAEPVPGADGRPGPRYCNATEYSVFAGSLGLLFALRGVFGGAGDRRRTAVALLLLLLALALFVPGVRLLSALPVVNHVHPFRWLAPMSLLVAWLAAAGLERCLQPRPQRRWPLPALAGLLLLGCTALAVLFGCERPFEALDAAARLAARYHVDPAAAIAYVDDGGDRFAAGAAQAASSLWRSAAGLLMASTCLLLLLGPRRRDGHAVRTAWLCCLCTAIELLLHGQHYAHGRVLQGDASTPVHAFLQQQQAEATAHGGIAIARAGTVPGLPDQLPPGMLLTAGVRDMHFDTHYDAHSHQPWLRLYGQGTAATGHLTLSLPDDARLQHPVLDLFGVTHLLATEPLQHAGELVHETTGRRPGTAFRVYRRPQALPRAFVVPDVAVLADDDAVLQRMVPLAADGSPLPPDGSWRPDRTALVTAADAAAANLAPNTATAPITPRPVTFLVDHATEVVLQVPAGPPALLVLSDSFLPGWSCRLDERPVGIVRVDHALRGVQLPADACTVQFSYRVPGLLPGLIAAAIGGLLLLALALRARARPASSSRAAAPENVS